MFIETDELYSIFLESYNSNSKFIFIPIFRSNSKHSIINDISFLYFINVDSKEWYVISKNHMDCLTNYYDTFINNNFNINRDLIVLDKKSIINYFKFNNINHNNINLVDINILCYLNNVDIIKLKIFNNYKKIINSNDLYPIPSFIKLLNEVSYDIINNYNKLNYYINSNEFNSYNNNIINALSDVELNGIYVDSSFKELISYNNLIYQTINIYHPAGRMSSITNGFNFFSMQKTTEYAKHIKSRYGSDGKLLLIDFKAFHLYLISNLINYKFNEYPYNYIAKCILGDKEELTPDIIKEIKKVTFKNLYGDVNELRDIDFFKEVIKFKTEVWDYYKCNNSINTLIYNRKFNIKNPNMNNVYNNLLQSYEFETVIDIIIKLNEYLKPYKTKLILNIYDSFIFDFNIKDGKNLVYKLIEIIKSELYDVSVKFSDDFANL